MPATPTRKKFGERLRQVRKNANLSQEELGFKAKLHRTYIGSIERGEQNISIDNIHKLARTLNIAVSDLFVEESAYGKKLPNSYKKSLKQKN